MVKMGMRQVAQNVVPSEADGAQGGREEERGDRPGSSEHRAGRGVNTGLSHLLLIHFLSTLFLVHSNTMYVTGLPRDVCEISDVH